MKGIVIWIAVLVIASAQAAAAELYIDVSPSEIWVGDSLNIDCYSGEDIQNVYANISHPEAVLNITNFEAVSSSHYTASYSPPKIGNYIVYCKNGTINSVSGSFQVASLSVNIRDYQETVYTDEDLYLEADVVKKIVSEEKISDAVFDVYLDSQKITMSSGYPIYNPSTYRYEIKSDISSFQSKNYTLKLDATYNGKTVSATKTISIKRPLDFEILSVSPAEVTGGENITVNLRAYYHGTDVLDASTLDVRLNNEFMLHERIANGLKFQSPEWESGTYTLSVTASYGTHQSSDTEAINYVVPIHGDLVNADGKSISGTLTFENDGFKKDISISNGKYSGMIPDGVYTVTGKFPDFTADFYGVTINGETEDLVRFDAFDSVEGLENVKIATGYGLEFTRSFSTVYINSKYNAKSVADENNIEVYVCHDWNFDNRKCNGNWEILDSDVDVAANTVSFETNSLSGFIIGEKKGIKLSVALDKSEYFLNETITLTGSATGPDGNPVANALIKYRLGSKYGETHSNDNGVFKITFLSPDAEGTYYITLNASKVLFEPGGTTKGFLVTKRKSLSFILPTSANTVKGKESKIEITIQNSGQFVLMNSNVTFSGIPEDWTYDYSPKSWDVFDPGTERKVMLYVTPTSSGANSISIIFDSDKYRKSDNFLVMVKDNESDSTPPGLIDASQDQTDYFAQFSQFTGFLTANPTATMNILSVIASVIIITFLGLKARRKPLLPKTRDHMMNLIITIRQEVFRGMGSGVRVAKARVRRKPKTAKPTKPKVRKRKKPVTKRPPRKDRNHPDERANHPHLTGIG